MGLSPRAGRGAELRLWLRAQASLPADSTNRPVKFKLLQFNTLREAQVLIEEWRRHYNRARPDSALGYLIVDSTIIRAHQHAAGAKKGGLKIRPLAAHAVA
jgi:transposase InsO family protein